MSKSNHSEVINVDAEELNEVISKELVRHNVTDVVIAGLKEKYGHLKIKDFNDKEGYLEVQAARKDVGKHRILAEKICKKGREHAIAEQKAWLAKEKEVVGKIAEIENYLGNQEDAFEAEKERVKKLKEQEEMQRFSKRQGELFKMGVQFDGENFTSEDVVYEALLVRSADDDIYAGIFDAYKKIYDRKEASRLAEEKRISDERAELENFRKQQEKKEQELRDQQTAIDKQQRELREAEEKKQKEKLDVLRAQRTSQLNALGLMYNGTEYFFEDINVHWNEIVTKTDDEWNKMIEEISPIIEDRKADIELKRIERIKSEERQRMEEQQRQDELKKQQEEARKSEELTQASDKIKWESVVGYLTAYKFPDFKSPAYKRKAQIAKEKIEEIEEL